MKKQLIVLNTGFALFSMFFGSGNLVFPIGVGQESGGHFLLGSLGILLTGVLVPFLGVLGMMLYNGDRQSFFGCFGKKGIFLFSLLALGLMGPFGVLARCLTVAHGALLLLIPQASLPFTSALMCLGIFLLALHQNKIVSVVGVLLTPFLLVSVAAIAFFGIKNGLGSDPVTVNATISGLAAFENGFFQGYQTMDLLAAFFFSTFVVHHLQKESKEDSVNIFYQSALVGAGILSLVYFALVLLGSIYAEVLRETPPQEMLGRIAVEALGSLAAPIVCLAIVLACFTTAIVLASLFADFLREEVLGNKIGNGTALFITLTIGFFVSTLDFAGISSFIGPVLEAVYPALIMLTVVNIVNKMWGIQTSHWPVTLTLAAKLCLT